MRSLSSLGFIQFYLVLRRRLQSKRGGEKGGGQTGARHRDRRGHRQQYGLFGAIHFVPLHGLHHPNGQLHHRGHRFSLGLELLRRGLRLFCHLLGFIISSIKNLRSHF